MSIYSKFQNFIKKRSSDRIGCAMPTKLRFENRKAPKIKKQAGWASPS